MKTEKILRKIFYLSFSGLTRESRSFLTTFSLCSWIARTSRAMTKNLFLFSVFCFLSFVPNCFSENQKPRYISLAPSTTEILFALGLNDEIVGVSSFCDYPKEAQSKDKIGDFSSPNLEKILSLRPDYIFCTGLEQDPAIIELRRQNIKVYVADPKNIAELLNSIKDIGRITNKQIQAENLVKDMRDRIEAITSKIKLSNPNRKPKVFIEIWDDPLTTAGRGSFIDELVSLVGAVNIAYDTKRPYSIFSAEEVIKRDPDCIILAYMAREKPLSKRLGWSGISAVKNNHVYNDIDPDILLRPGPRIVLGLEEIYKRLYE